MFYVKDNCFQHHGVYLRGYLNETCLCSGSMITASFMIKIRSKRSVRIIL